MICDIDVTEQLLKNNIKPSYQRLKILGFLAGNKNHPTAEQIFHALVDEIPTLSKTTVYNSINLFIQAGIIQAINIEDHETRYDYNINVHGHFKCLLCGKVFDFPLETDVFATNLLNGFKLLEKSVYCKGYCPQCLEK